MMACRPCVTNHILAFILLATIPPGPLAAETLPPLIAGKAPTNLDELWAGFDPRKEPLEDEMLHEWEQDGAVCRVVRYRVGVFKGAPATIAAFYAFPKGGTTLPAILELHGGGQSASLASVVTWARRGYAALSLNWGGNRMAIGREAWDGPQTDWGRLDATHPPQRNTANHFAGPLAPDDFTLDAVESPRNSSWFLVLLAARRAVTFLEERPEVDAARIGVRGHSMGGKLTINLAGIDERIRVAVPSCGGSGDIVDGDASVPGGKRDARTALERACISDNAYLPRVTCPVLWLSPTNDFHAHIDAMAWNWRGLPDDRLRFSISPHLNHRHVDEHAVTEWLWFDQHLRNAAFTLPQTPGIDLQLETTGGVPRVVVTPDRSQPVRRVDVYYAIDPHALTRFWRDATAVEVDGRWQADCPVMNLDEPIIAFANVVYDAPEAYRAASPMTDNGLAGGFVISSRLRSAGPAALRAAGVKATDRPDRVVDDGTRGWHDWYRLNWGHPPLWAATTRKLKDPKWRGPDGARLAFEIICERDNEIVLTFTTNAWGAMVPGKPPIDYAVVKPLRGSPDWQSVAVRLEELVATDPAVTAPPTDWRTVTEFTISPSGTTVRDGEKVKVDGTAWVGPRTIRNLRWEGGEYPRHQTTGVTADPHDFRRNFDDAIRRSLEQETLDAK
jgi:dienelactone hydrolase